MININKSLIAGVALLAGGLAVAVDMAQSHAVSPMAPAAVVAARFPTAGEMLFARVDAEPLAAPKADRIAPASCAHEHWPSLDGECLAETAPTVRPVRTITIQRRIAENASEVTRVEVREVAGTQVAIR
jgi:hypothetical protein